MTESCVEFRGVFKHFADKPIIEGITLDLARDLTVALVGESGSGKSTLLQIINGLVRPDRGEVRVLGEAIDYQNLPRLRRKMGYAVQGAGLFPHLTVRENVTLMARLEGWARYDIEQRLTHLLGLIELPLEFADRFPHMLSGGQQQRVGLCRAMMLNPPLMLMDEPFSALDPITREAMHKEFHRLQQAESRSIILVTHDMSEAVKLASYLVILKDGKVVQHGAMQSVRDAPADEYVRQLFAGASVP
jgi:osmoprotectant transport system ATP-binding protein